MAEVAVQNKRISIFYDPFKNIEKAADSNGLKHRYLRGITSGTKVDGHGERVTANCIQSLQEQGRAGTVLLFADKHGVAYTDDIGILDESEITPEGDWICTFRLYDESDGVSQDCLDTIDKLWKQVNGLHPYKVPLQKGFSIEGYIPDNGILSSDAEGGHRVIDQITLDGAVVVPRPAYRQSVAQAVYKTLEENSPWVEKKIEKAASSFKREIATEELSNNYFKFNYKFQDKLQEITEKLMLNPSVRDKKSALDKVFKEYSDSMIELILASKDMFGGTEKEPDNKEDFQYLYTPSANSRMEVLKNLLAQVGELESTLISR